MAYYGSSDYNALYYNDGLYGDDEYGDHEYGDDELDAATQEAFDRYNFSKTGKASTKELNRLLLVAVSEGHLEVAQFLRRRGASVRAKNCEGQSTMQVACSACDGKMVKFLLRHAAIVSQDNLLACVMENSDHSTLEKLAIMETLLRKGARPQTKHLQLLLHACEHGKEAWLHLLKLLLRLRCKTSARANGGKCPLSVACSHQNWEAARLLVPHCTQVNCANKKGMTPLMMATEAGELRLIRLLLKHRAKLQLTNDAGNRADQMTDDSKILSLLQPKLGQHKVKQHSIKSTKGTFKASHSTECGIESSNSVDPFQHVKLEAFLESEQAGYWWDMSAANLQERLRKLSLQHLGAIVINSKGASGAQQQAYLGNNEALLQYMRDRNMTTMTTKSVRSWLEKHGGFPTAYQDGNLTLADCDIDHILPHSIGGQDHPYNYVLLPRRLNGSLGGFWTPDKQAYLGKQVAKTAKDFFKWVRQESRRLGLNCNDFHQHRYSV